MNKTNSDKGRNLREIITSNENIYNAVYCMESYVFEKGLLDDNDLQLYNSLHDKFDFEKIEDVMQKCKERLIKLLDEKDELFTVTVYFKLKKLEKGSAENSDEIKYRPIHTASLVDQICMVCMLLPLMFDDSSGKRKRSELTKMIPHDFYGNIPSEDVEMLFKPWMNQYKSYSETIIEHCKEYRKNHRYKTEITLDIKNFFPSISPYFIFDYITKKLDFILPEEDKNTLDMVLTKLLIFKIEKKNLDGWNAIYYGREISEGKNGFYSRGVAQGLPQSYFFGNLCMTEIRKEIMKHQDFKQCDSFFYVDDSVIYIGQPYDKEQFEETIQNLNDAIKSIGHYSDTDIVPTRIADILNDDYCKFQKELNDSIVFHDTDKSDFCRIEEAGISIAGLEPLMRNASMAASVFNNTDEIEDSYSQEKLEKVSELINDEIKRLKDKISEQKHEPNSCVNVNQESRLKLIKRYKRFYLYRLRLLERRLSNEISTQDIADFKNRFKVPCFTESCKLQSCLINTRAAWFDNYDEDIFQSEARMLISMLSLTDAEKFKDELFLFEQRLAGLNCGSANYLFFNKDFSATFTLKRYFCNPYTSISRRIKLYLSPIHSLSPIRQKQNFEKFVLNLSGYRNSMSKNIWKDEQWILPDYTNFIFRSSDEYVRIILNAFYSAQNDIEPSDARIFTKYSSRGLHYTELRILTRLRNKSFVLKQFVRALEDIDEKNLDNRMAIDMGLLDVINVFISKVRKPEWIDNIILTHRVVKGLWYNGSKFMNSYTLHNEEHAVTLIKAVVRLVKAVDYLNIKQTDYYIIFLACYLHDISMVIHPNINNFCSGDQESLPIASEFITKAYEMLHNTSSKANSMKDYSSETLFKDAGNILVANFESVYNYFSNNIRRSHPKESADIIRVWHDSVLKHLSPLLLTHVAKVSESHGYDADEVYGVSSDAKRSLVSEKYSMILIRLADLMDVANDRINYNLLRQNVSHMSKESKFHWISHLVTDEIQVYPTYYADDKINEPIENRKIKEHLNFNIFVNVKFLEAINKPCKICRLVNHLDSNIVKLPPEYADSHGLMLEMFGHKEHFNTKTSSCPVLCRWMVKKHEWFVNELVALNSYLNAVNDRWFETEIRFNIIYRDDFPLDKDLYDVVYDFINSSN